jgi:hypothetical protein
MWMRMCMRRKQHHKTMMDRCSMCRTEGIVDDVVSYECDDADADVEEDAPHDDEGSLINVEDCGHCTRECEDWTGYFRHIKYYNDEANEKGSDVSEAKTVLQ